MPQRARVPCRGSGCRELVIGGGFCEKHKALNPAVFYERFRGSPASRGYDNEWFLFRRQLLQQAEYALCRDCKDEGKIVLAQELHHIRKVRDFPLLKYDVANIMPLCTMHHSKRTAKGE